MGSSTSSQAKADPIRDDILVQSPGKNANWCVMNDGILVQSGIGKAILTDEGLQLCNEKCVTFVFFNLWHSHCCRTNRYVGIDEILGVEMRLEFEGISLKKTDSASQNVLVLCASGGSGSDHDLSEPRKMLHETSGRVSRHRWTEIGLWLDDPACLSTFFKELSRLRLSGQRNPELYMERMLHFTSGRIPSNHCIQEKETMDMMTYTSGRLSRCSFDESP
jgi:hypothetical protein